MRRKSPARYTKVRFHQRTSKYGRKFDVEEHRRKLPLRRRRVKRRRVPRLIRPEMSRSIHELSKDEVEYSGAFDFNPHSPKIENAILREGETWSVTLPPSQVRLKFPELFEEYDRDFEVTWHTHPKGGFPYLPSPRDVVSFYRDSAQLGQENHLVYVEETESVFLVHVPRKKAIKTIKQQKKDLFAWEEQLDDEWNRFNHLPMDQRITARRRMMNNWAKKYGFRLEEFSIHHPIVVYLIPEEPKRIKRRI